MVVEDALIQYGVLGVWTVTLLVERYKTLNKMSIVIDNNTIALTKNYEVITKCQKKN